jgi:TRAP-type C4-dicarboxylate transport system permease large subunit
MMTRALPPGATARYDPHMRRSRVLHVLSETFWVFVLGIVCLFVFFVLMGALSPAEAVGVSVAIAILAALWVGHAMWESRHRDGRDPDVIRARERRGF